ncbi:MAG: hypothetical protein EA417_02175 [Gammaproteobacteria bacterium]|nr:MAG: hypothetical protein EA417_02175 [Gammaproteobacteria bacterium]
MRERLRFIASGGWGFIRAIARLLMTDAGDRLIAEVRSTVRRIDNHDWPGTKKRQAAVAVLLGRLGLPAYLVNCLIELAVAELRDEEE